jgi:hypothetical protein
MKSSKVPPLQTAIISHTLDLRVWNAAMSTCLIKQPVTNSGTAGSGVYCQRGKRVFGSCTLCYTSSTHTINGKQISCIFIQYKPFWDAKHTFNACNTLSLSFQWSRKAFNLTKRMNQLAWAAPQRAVQQDCMCSSEQGTKCRIPEHRFVPNIETVLNIFRTAYQQPWQFVSLR